MSQSTFRAVRTALLILAVAFVGSACTSRVTGNEGNLSFEYVADDRPLDFNKPIAVGARLELRVREAGSLQLVDRITSAGTDDESVLQVVDISGPTLIVEGVGAGNALIEVEAALASGGVLSDSVNMTARVPEVLDMRHSCTDGDTGTYLVDQNIWLWFDMEMANGQPVIGYGYHPVAFDPGDGMALDETTRNQQWFELLTSDTPQTVTISSEIDETEVTAILVEASDIDGAVLIGDYGALVDVPTWYYTLPLRDEARICQANTELTVEVLTPDICEVTLPVDEPTDEEIASSVGAARNTEGPDETINESGWLRVVGFEVGVCEFSVTYTEGADGAGVETEMSVDIIDIERPE